VQTNDPKLVELAMVMAEWRKNIGLRVEKTVKEVIDRAITIETFHVALLDVAQNRTGGTVNNKRLGIWLHNHKGRIVNGVTFKSRMLYGALMWSLVPI
jgi:hypothetical protein